jgi:hypothetical protein
MRSRPDIIASVVSWGDAVSGSARHILKEAESIPDTEAAGERREAAEFLTDFLSDGPKSQKEVKEAADANCHAWRSVRRAQKDLGIKPSKSGMTGSWIWALAEDAHQTPKMLTPERLSTFGNSEHLRDESEAISESEGEAVNDKWGIGFERREPDPGSLQAWCLGWPRWRQAGAQGTGKAARRADRQDKSEQALYYRITSECRVCRPSGWLHGH